MRQSAMSENPDIRKPEPPNYPPATKGIALCQIKVRTHEYHREHVRSEEQECLLNVDPRISDKENRSPSEQHKDDCFYVEMHFPGRH